MKKYEFTEDTKVYNGRTLHRIKTLIDLPYAKAGELGGWIESERNLSHDGNCFVYDEAIACDTSRVNDCARLQDNAIIQDSAIIMGHAVISDNAIICDTSWVGDFAKVLGNAIVSDKSCVYDFAKVLDNAQIREIASISDFAVVRGNAIVRGTALVFENAIIRGESCVFENAIVGGDAFVMDSAMVGGNVSVRGRVDVKGDTFLSEDAVVTNPSDFVTFCGLLVRDTITYTFSNDRYCVKGNVYSSEELINREGTATYKPKFQTLINFVEQLKEINKNNG